MSRPPRYAGIEKSMRRHLNRAALLDVNALEKRIVESVKGFSKYTVVDELIVDLRGGEALEAVIKRLQTKHADIPGLFWEFVQRDGCASLGKQCKERVYDTSFEGYIPISDDISLDVWMTSQQILEWKQGILSNFTGLNILRQSQKRQELEKTLAESLKKVIKKPEIEANESYANYLQRRKGLPVSIHSPLLSYTPSELQNENLVPDCEIDRMAVWATNVNDMLGIIYDGRFKPNFQAGLPPESACPKASQNGRRIPLSTAKSRKSP